MKHAFFIMTYVLLFATTATSSTALEQLLHFNHDLQEITEASSNESGKLGFLSQNRLNTWEGPEKALDTLRKWIELQDPSSEELLSNAVRFPRFRTPDINSFKEKYLEDYVGLTDVYILRNLTKNRDYYTNKYRPEVIKFLDEANVLLDQVWKKIENWRKEDFPSVATLSLTKSVYWKGPEKALAYLQKWANETNYKNQPFLYRAVDETLNFKNSDDFKKEYLSKYVDTAFSNAFEENRKHPDKYRQEVREFLTEAEPLLEELWKQVEKWRNNK